MSGALQWNIGGVCEMNDNGTVRFADDTTGEFDVVIFSTGYQLDLPFLDDDTRKKVRAEELRGYPLDLGDFSLLPELPQLAFVGMFAPGAASFPAFDSQTRWIAKVIADPDSAEQRGALGPLEGVQGGAHCRDGACATFLLGGAEPICRAWRLRC